MTHPFMRRAASVLLGVLALGWGFVALVVTPLQSDVEQLRRELPVREARLRTLEVLDRDQARLSRLMASASSRLTGSELPSLLSTIEGVVKRLGLSERAISMRPVPVTQTVRNTTEEKLEIRFVSLGMRNMVDFIDAVEALALNVKIESLLIKKTGTTATMNLVISSLVFGSGKR